MIKLPQNNQWTQPNSSYKSGSLWATKNINLDEEGVIKLSPRSVNLFDDSEDVSNTADTDYGIPVAFGRQTYGTFFMGTTDEPFNIDVSATAKSISEDASANNPNMTTNSHACWWQNRWYTSTDTAVSYNTAGTWTADAITGLTSGKRHWLTVFKNRRTLCVANGNVVKQYNADHSASTDLTLPSDYEVMGMAYNSYKVGIVTRLGDDTTGQNSNSFFFAWDGSDTEAQSGIDIGAAQGVAVGPYKSSFVILTSEGQLLYFNGGGFDELARLPFYISQSRTSDLNTVPSYGDVISQDGDILYINIGFNLTARGKNGEKYVGNNPMGVWCYDPKVGLYHRYSPSISRHYQHSIAEANVDLSTNIFTTTNTIPATGNPIILTSQTVGGLKNGAVYYIIKLSSTTFAIAETKDLALAGVKIDITSKSTNQFFAMYDIVDYGASYGVTPGAIGMWGETTLTYTDIIFGSRVSNTALGTMIVLNTTTPRLENRGYFVTPKLFLDSQSEKVPGIIVKYRPLNDGDKIIVKSKFKDFYGLPTTTPNDSGASATWTSDKEFYTASDISVAKTLFDAGVELEVELTVGVGAGQMVKITNIAYEGGTYAVTLDEAVVGASAGLKSHFMIDNWTTCESIDSTNQKEGVTLVSVSGSGKAPQFKFELRGVETAIEDIIILNNSHIPAL